MRGEERGGWGEAELNMPSGATLVKAASFQQDKIQRSRFFGWGVFFGVIL